MNCTNGIDIIEIIAATFITETITTGPFPVCVIAKLKTTHNLSHTIDMEFTQ